MKHLITLLLLAICLPLPAQVDAMTGATQTVSSVSKKSKKIKQKEAAAQATDLTTDTATPIADEKTDTISEPRQRVKLETSKGDIVVELYNETPLHRDNFIKLVRAGYYDGILWHRVIKDFMIQAGDSTTRHAQPGAEVGTYDAPYTLPAEIRFPQFFHRRGVLAAARQGDDVNPERRSAAGHFYIVWGYTYGPNGLAKAQEKLDQRTNNTVKLTEEIKEVYTNVGGAAHLDGQYTVYGEVVEGLDVVQAINYVDTDDRDRPLTDVRIIRATVLE